MLTYFETQLPMFGDYKQVLKKLQILAPTTPFIGAPVAIEKEMNSEEDAQQEKLSVGDWRKNDRYWKQRKKPSR